MRSLRKEVAALLLFVNGTAALRAGTILQSSRHHVAKTAALPRRTVLHSFATLITLPATRTLATDAPAEMDSSEVVEEKFSVPAGLARLRLELVGAESALDSGELTGPEQLQMALRTPVFATFLGFLPDASDKKAKDSMVEKQVTLLASFPAQSQRQGAQSLRNLLSNLQALNECSRGTKLDEQEVCMLFQSARTNAEEVNKQYYAEGCMVCPDPVKAGSGSEMDEFDNPNLRKLLEVEKELNKNRLRRPDVRDEALARKLGFREGELIGGYD